MLNKAFELFLCCAALAVTFGVQAVGFGSVSPSTVLGQPLNVTVPIHLDSGERLAAECVSAEVISGESRIPPDEVRVLVQQGNSPTEWIARITTLSSIQEPVVEVSISAGCERRFMRRFTAFADPPQTGAASPVFGAMAAPQTVSPGSAGLAGNTRALGGNPESNGQRSNTASRPLAERNAAQATPKPRPGPVRRAATAPGSTAVAAAARPVKQAAGSVPATPAVPRDSQVARLLLDVGGGSQLRMDMEEPLMRAPASAMAMASEAAAIVGAEPVAEPDRLALLERTLSDLKRDSQVSQQANAGIRARLADAEAHSRLLPWLLALLLFLLLVAVWLALRLRRQARELEAGPKEWWASGMSPLDASATGPVPEPVSSTVGELVEEPLAAPPPPAPRAPAALPAAAAVAAVAAADWQAASVEPDPHERTAAFAPPAFGLESSSVAGLDAAAGSAAREVSVEELLDLEQQADFFIALGQEDAAVDLLMAHLRSTGGLSPLPYTKLLEIYKRQGDRGAYERVRARFNRRFNAYAPHWDIGPLQGRTLEEYPDVVGYLESIWPSPLDAMAVLEAMLFRKDETQELFDLPAYKDVLLLYSLARDLWQQGGAVTAEVVDVLLPLGDAGAPPLTDSGRSPLYEAPAGQDYDLTSFELEPRASTRATLDPGPTDKA